MKQIDSYTQHFFECFDELGQLLDAKMCSLYEKYKDEPNPEVKKEVMEMYNEWKAKYNKPS
jgi:hypothetical protein